MKYERQTTLQALVAELSQIADDEGLIKSIYSDTEGYLTFGFGTLITRDMPEHGCPAGTPVSESRCLQALFDEVVNKTLADGPAVFGSHWDRLPFEAKKVFINMTYNLGRSRFSGFKNMIAAAKRGDWNNAADEALDSKWARQVKSRATRLADRLRTLA